MLRKSSRLDSPLQSKFLRFGLIQLLFATIGTFVVGEVLEPPYFNLAFGKKITASHTCGQDDHGNSYEELYCKLVGASSDSVQTNLVQGQFCDICDASKVSQGKNHPIEYAIDGSERWWQSPPLSRSMSMNEVNITIDLGQEFHVAYVIVRMGNSPRPGVWVLERSADGGVTYKPWQYFADTSSDCEHYFGRQSLRPITRDDSVFCDTQYSKLVPLEGGEIFLRLLDNRPSRHDFFGSDALQEFTRTTNIRLRLLRTKTLFGHLMYVKRQDSTVTRRYFYSIKDISVGGTCRCNGHAEVCDHDESRRDVKLVCVCQHNTCGDTCEYCCPGYVQRQWKAATKAEPFVCEACNCNGHSRECYYDEEVDKNRTSLDTNGQYRGGGVCINCRHNTEGINCNMCKPGYFRPEGKYWNETDVCQRCQCDPIYQTGNCDERTGRCECRPQFTGPSCTDCNVGYYGPTCKPCDCHVNGTVRQICEVGGGQCPCLPNYTGKNCDSCAENYFNFPECLSCDCDPRGSLSRSCDPDEGQCECGNKFGGRQCNTCDNGYFGFPECTYCECDLVGSEKEVCDKNTGTCICREGYGGARCDECANGFYGYPECIPCNCSEVGTSTISTLICEPSGKCPCLPNFSGRACDQCKAGYRSFPKCLPCNCDTSGTMGVSCDDEGKCFCKPNFDDLLCNRCKEGFYNFPDCEDCNCDPRGVVETFYTYGACANASRGELCKCKQKVQGRICNECKPLYWNLQHYYPDGCEDCNCNGNAVLGGVLTCDGKHGQCVCKPHVGTRKCEECQNGFYNLVSTNLLGCDACDCDVGGAYNNNCDKGTGQCICRPRIEGIGCTQPTRESYFPTLYQFQHEAENGFTRAGGQVRFRFNSTIFPDYSWRGYAVYSQVQPETFHDIFVEKSSLYRMVLRYVNPTDQPITGEITASPDNPNDIEQKLRVRFEPNNEFVTVSSNGGTPSPIVINNAGRWRFSIKVDQYLMIDYFVLLPAAYYEGSILQTRATKPCLVNNPDNSIPCNELRYPDINNFDSKLASESYIDRSGSKDQPTRRFTDRKILDALDVKELVLLSPQQDSLTFDLNIAKSGRFVVLVEYFTPSGITSDTRILVEGSSKKGKANGQAVIYDCQYSIICREAVISLDGQIEIFRFDNPATITLRSDSGSEVAIKSITAVPFAKWSMDHIKPRQFCVQKDGDCVASSFSLPPDSTKVEAEANNPDRIVSDDAIQTSPGSKPKLIVLDSNDRSIDITGRVSRPNYYKFLIHYYQPISTEFNIDVIVKNGQHQAARLPIAHCPSLAGCRSQIVQEEGNSVFFIDDDFTLTLQNSPKEVWIDYVLAVPEHVSDEEMTKAVQQIPLDDTSRFISECGQNHFYLSPATSGFCRDSIFSLSADFNNGAKSCECDSRGSRHYECEMFGGQCPCKENVIGRKCEKCRTGFYQFPECLPCDCPSDHLCDANGACICPPNVIGARCDTCELNTYGFDSLIGCEPCGCDTQGVLDSRDLQCDLITGSCKCKENVVGRTCDKCLTGHWWFPQCKFCGCDLRGTTEEICNQETRECYCKQYVSAGYCDKCEPGSFNLEERNPNGCTKCFCFGKTTKCSSSQLNIRQITPEKSDWSALAINPKDSNFETNVIDYNVEFEDTFDDTFFSPFYVTEELIGVNNDTHAVYFKAALNSNFLSSYGGVISYSMVSDPTNVPDRDSFSAPDVIIEGKELPPSTNVIRLLHYTIDHLDGEHTMKMTLPLFEENFLVANAGSGNLVTATRDQLMIVLKGLNAVYIRASYWKRTREARLTAFSFEVGVKETYIDPMHQAVAVENCTCPINYVGLSCEECAPGYYRSTSGPFGGHCVPCNCHRHAETCDPVSGLCIECKDNTRGEHCEMCEIGYHGDATLGTPYDCLICACPLPIASNNFATSCEFSRDGSKVSCQCKENYFGLLCDSCDSGYFGQPTVIGEYCRPCQCSGNIDVNDPAACDTVTGACLRCMNNTGGPACNLCKRGYFGDALITKDCKECECDQCGTHECDSFTGDCTCLPNVIGVNCNRCRPDYFGLSRCDQYGCQSCNCGIASNTTQCHDLSGQCECKPGTTGRRCERCLPGFWNYTSEGCQPCACNINYSVGVGCNPETGQCSCLRGVEGEKCDRCPYRWVLDLTDDRDPGCKPCSSCQHQLLDVTDRIAAILNPVKKEFDEVAVTYFTTQRMTYFNNTAASLEADVALLDPSKENLQPFYQIVTDLETSAKSYKQKAESTSESLKEKSTQSLALRVKAVQMESDVQETVAKARTAVFETKDLLEGLLAKDKLTSPQTEAAIVEARATIDNMNRVQFDSTAADTEQENAITKQVLANVTEFVKPLTELGNELKLQSEGIINVRKKLKDLRNETDYSLSTSLKAKDIITKIKDARYPAKFTLLSNRADETKNNIASAIEYNGMIPKTLSEFNETMRDLGQVLSSVKELREKQEQSTNTLINELGNNKDTILISQNHARDLKRQADGLDRMFGQSKRTSETAFAAATAYQKISDALADAETTAEKAKRTAENATEMVKGLEQSARSAIEPSQNLLRLSGESVTQVDDQLQIPLRDAKLLIADINRTTARTNNSLTSITSELDKSEATPASTVDLNKAMERSSEAIDKAQATLRSVANVVEKLPNDEGVARQLPITVADLNKGVEVSDNQLRKAKDSIPLSVAITESLTEKQPNLERKREEIGKKLADLKARIAAARELANRVQVGMDFVESSNLIASNPQSLDSQQVRTEITFYFKTREPYGLLLFLGNEPGRKVENDFIAIEIEGGYPVLTLDLGAKPQKFVISDKYVADDKWYKATVDRNGRRVRFSISEETSDGRPIEYANTDYYRLGTKSLLNVDRNSSKLFVGGFPPGQFRNPVHHSSYHGTIEDLNIGGQRVGLWNFKEALNVQPAEGRDRFLNLRPERGLRFLGNGYAVMSSKPHRFVQESAIRLSFRTRAQNGLLFLVGKGRKFMSLEIVDGKIVFQYDLGAGVGSVTTPETYNDGRWHVVLGVREKTNGILRVNNMERGHVRSPPGAENLAVSDFMYFGGYPGRHDYPDVTNRDFDGCIDNVVIYENSLDLSEATDSRDTMIGCPASQVEQVATFYGDGFLKIPVGDARSDGPVVSPSDDQFELNFRFRSNATNGLLFYGSDPTHSNYLSISLENGALNVIENSGTKIKSQKLNDANWHVVTVTRDQKKLSLNVDDADDQSKDAPGGPLILSSPGSSLLFGGHPPSFTIPSHTTASSAPFQGCLADINFNGDRIDFGDSESEGSSVSQKCLTGDRPAESNGIGPTISTVEGGDDDENELIPITTRRTTTTTTVSPIEDEDFPDFDLDFEEPTTTTTPRPKTMDDPSPTPFEQCALPFRTRLPLDNSASLDDGIRFGNFERSSRLELQEPQTNGSLTDYTIEFKTSEPDGLILMKTNGASSDFVALYLRGGSVHFAFDPGSSMALLNSSSTYNDDKWHKVRVSQELKDGELEIDDRIVAKGSSGGQTQDINAGTILYVGGLSENLWQIRDTNKKLQGMNSPFRGCLRNLRSKIAGRTIMEPIVKHSIEPCTGNVEDGFYFYPRSGYMTIARNFKVLQRFKISLKIKPRTPTGLILAVHGPKDYLVLQMINGTVKFTVDNGRGALTSSFTKDPYDLCDGSWHNIQVQKTKNVVTLAVDNTFALPGIGSAGSTWTDTNNPLYFGGHPSPNRVAGVETSEQFVGCIKDLLIEGNRTAVNYNYDAIVGRVGIHSCPAD